MFNFDEALKLICGQTIVCIGDLMLDDFVYGEVSRISPEAPAPILAVRRNELTVGGAGNVARNIAALGARCIFLGVVGEDEDRKSTRLNSSHVAISYAVFCLKKKKKKKRNTTLHRKH